MIFEETPLAGAYLIRPERLEDERGWLARSFCAEEFAHRGLESRFVQSSIVFNARKDTLRGLHYQAAPHAEVKLVRCTHGRVFDVIVDLRSGSPTCGKWHGIELESRRHETLYVPGGFAHGYQTLEDECELFYQMSVPFEPSAQRGLRWDDPRLAIDWPQAARRQVSARDAALPFYGAT
jgi:dTDP-4-dehydrorhamnose 3,5-epimerase